MRKQGVNFRRRGKEGSSRDKHSNPTVEEAQRLLLDQPPTLLLHTPLGRVEDHQLATLLQFWFSSDDGLAFIVIRRVFGGRFSRVHPFGGAGREHYPSDRE